MRECPEREGGAQRASERASERERERSGGGGMGGITCTMDKKTCRIPFGARKKVIVSKMASVVLKIGTELKAFGQGQ